MGVRLRTTLAATVVVAVALVAGAALLVTVVRDSLADGLASTAESRAGEIVRAVDDGRSPAGGESDNDDVDEPEDLIWQVRDASGTVVDSSQPLSTPLPLEDDATIRPAGAEHDYLLATDETDDDGTVVVAVSAEPVDDATSALVTPLALGLPVVLMMVAGAIWMVSTRSLRPVERMRREVDRISTQSLGRRVPVPEARDEIHRLATTMNRMLGRLEEGGRRQREFVADASHELRTPIAILRQTGEVAQAHPGALAEGELAETVVAESVRMQRLVEQLLQLARGDEPGRGRPRLDIDLDDLVLAEGARVRGAELRVDTSGVGPGRVQGDPIGLSQLVRNLVDNAARHAASSLMLGVRTAGDAVELIVADDGSGVPPEDRERIFERFVRLDEARARDTGGSGLGLAIVQEIVGAHGGTIRIEDAAPGARFVVVLPTSRPS